MLITKHAAELCALLVNDLFGELPSRILVALFAKGRCTISQLCQQTSLSPRHIRNGLGVLIQQNLLYHHANPDTKVTNYEANSNACYNLVRSGKILEVINDRYGNAERDLVQTLMQLGYAKIADLEHAFTSRASKVNGHKNGSHELSSGLIESKDHLYSVLGRLIQAEILETVRPESFRNPSEVYREIEADVTKTGPGEKAAKNKIEMHMQVVERYKTFRDQTKGLKRHLDQTSGPITKRRKIRDGPAHQDDYVFDDAPNLNPNVIVRVNYERCLVELRNQRLVDYAADQLGEATGEVYRALLDLLTVKLARCRADPLTGEQNYDPSTTVTTMQIYEHLSDDVNVSGGIGKPSKDLIDTESAEKIRPGPYSYDSDSDSDSDSGTDAKPSVKPAAPPRGRMAKAVSAAAAAAAAAAERDATFDDDDDDEDRDRQTTVKFEDGAAPKESRIEQMRNHLLLLSESKHRFVRHSGKHGRGQWAVDFDLLMDRLREFELDAYIEQLHGRYGLRLTRILREKGKLDEKVLPSAALMKKSDVQGKMLAMQMGGLVDVQEVPRDNSRLANRTFFLWFFDGERTQTQLLDDVYKGMLRCLQTLDLERHKERDILSFVERKDVKGKEQEVMTTEHYNKYNRHLEGQQKLLGQVLRLDDLVSVFRDY